MTSLTRRLFPALLCAFTLTAAAQTPSPTPDTGISIPNMDPAVRPGDNFYLYANGGYIARTQLPADRAGLRRLQRPLRPQLRTNRSHHR